MRKPKKISDTSVRVLETLKFLATKNASIQDIIRYFEKFDPNNRIYTNEVILKYINTLKVFGFRFRKQKDKYILLNLPQQFDLNEKDLKSISVLEKYAGLFPEEKVTKEIQLFLYEIERRYSDNTCLIANNIKKPNLTDLNLVYFKHIKQIQECEKYCIDTQRLKITYEKPDHTTATIIAEPCEIKYLENEVYFSVYNPSSAQIQDLKINSIIKIEQLPLKSNSINMPSTVSFRLKGRLAKAYNLHEGEKLLQIEKDGSTIILNQREDKNLLIKRLMRYGENCELITPKNLREEMRELIKSTIENYI